MYALNRQIIKMGKIYYILLNLSEKDVMQSELVCLYQTITQKIDQIIDQNKLSTCFMSRVNSRQLLSKTFEFMHHRNFNENLQQI